MAPELKKLKVKPEHILDFPQGLIGFCSAKRFVLIDEPSSERFLWLTSVDQPDLSFLVVRAEEVISNYEPAVEKADLEFLGLKSIEDAEVFNIVTLPHRLEGATVNLQSPVLINPKTRLGKQIVLEHGRYPIQHPLLKEQASAKAGSGV